MNKLFKSVGAITLGLAMAAGVGVGVSSKVEEAKAGDSVVYTLTPVTGSNSSYAGNCDIDCDGVTWNLTGNSQQIPWRLGGKSLSGVDRKLFSKTSLAQDISKIELRLGTNSGSITVNSLTLNVGKSADGADVSVLAGTYAKDSTVTFERPSATSWKDCYFEFVFNLTVSVTSNKYVTVSGADFYSDSTDTPLVTLDKNNVTVAESSESVTATPENITNPTYAWAVKAGSDDCVELSNANSATVTISPKDIIFGQAVVTLTVNGDNLTGPITKEVNVTKKPTASKPATVAEAIAIIDEVGGTITDMYVAGIVCQIDSYNSEYHSVQYWISDDGTTTGKFEVYSGRNYNDTDFASKDDLSTGMYLVIFGNIKKYTSTYEFDRSSYPVAIAENFSSFFLSDTDKVCSLGDVDNLEALQEIWGAQKDRYTALSASEKELLVSSSASQNMKNALARYDFVCHKYNVGGVNLEEFISGHVVPTSVPSTVIPHDNVASSNTSIIIIVAVAVASVTGLGILLVLKRRKGLVK